MSVYNYFGCTVNDIVSFYHGTTLNDFSTNGISGSDIITTELEYAEETVLNSLPKNFSQVLFNGIPYVEIYDGQTIAISGVALSDLKEMGSDDPFLNGDTSLNICEDGGCPGDISVLSNSLATVSISGTTVSISGYDSNRDYYARLTFTDEVSFSGLKKLVRDLVACRLGSQLFSRGGEDEWIAVRRACEDSQKMLEKLESDVYWMPFELRKLNYFDGTSPIKIKGGISTFKVYRG